MDQPRIFYFCYDHQNPTGGQKQAYAHVDILNNNGYNAFALHLTEGFRLTWFQNHTRVINLASFKQIYQPQRDILVLPEDLGEKILSFPGQKVIFNQNCYYGFSCFGFSKPRCYPYLDGSVMAVLTVSEHNKRQLQYAFPDLQILRVVNSIDSQRFSYRPVAAKKKIIACLPRKNPLHLNQVYHILQCRAAQRLNNLSDYGWAFMRNFSEEQVAQIFSDSLLFLFLSSEEGLPLMPLEAMLSGCLVFAYDCEPLTEYLNPMNAFLYEKHALGKMIEEIEELAADFPEKLERLQSKSEAARETALWYSRSRQEESLLAAWAAILEEKWTSEQTALSSIPADRASTSRAPDTSWCLRQRL
ncbi:MAG: glycosyltransferase family 4 protein [Deltaproteobacteria bacterium]|nr:glycosyltransferase family 4 protein [Deltaproteobacteria bacterium]MBW2071766.1 glycosyltransferase family 4 protein [Deltaproteobacteria bacterium]